MKLGLADMTATFRVPDSIGARAHAYSNRCQWPPLTFSASPARFSCPGVLGEHLLLCTAGSFGRPLAHSVSHVPAPSVSE